MTRYNTVNYDQLHQMSMVIYRMLMLRCRVILKAPKEGPKLNKEK